MLLLSFQVTLSHGGSKYKKISLCWDVIISTHGMRWIEWWGCDLCHQAVIVTIAIGYKHWDKDQNLLMIISRRWSCFWWDLELEKTKNKKWQDFWMVSMKKFLVLLRCFHIIICKVLLLCTPREKFSKRDVEGLMGTDPFQLHGIGSKPVPLLLGGITRSCC